MTSQTPDLAAVVARLEKVERQNRQLKLAGVMVLLLAVAGLLMGQAGPSRLPKTVEAEEFVLRDSSGRLRARLATEADGSSGLWLYDKDANRRAWLAMLPDGRPSLSLRDKDRRERAVLTVLPDGRPSLDLFDQYTVPHVTLSTTPDGSPVLMLFDRNGKVLWKAS